MSNDLSSVFLAHYYYYHHHHHHYYYYYYWYLNMVGTHLATGITGPQVSEDLPAGRSDCTGRGGDLVSSR